MKLAGAQRTKLARRVFLNRRAKFFRQARWLEPRERQMRRKRPLFTRDAEFFRGPIDIGGKSFQIRRSLDPRPENARVFFVGEKPDSAKIERDRLLRTHASKSVSNGREFCFRHFPDEFKRHMKILRTYPARLRRDPAKRLDQRREISPHHSRNLQRDKQAHGKSGPFGAARRRLPAVVEEMDAHHVERQLRGMPAHRFTVAREKYAALLDATGMRERDVHRA